MELWRAKCEIGSAMKERDRKKRKGGERETDLGAGSERESPSEERSEHGREPVGSVPHSDPQRLYKRTRKQKGGSQLDASER